MRKKCEKEKDIWSASSTIGIGVIGEQKEMNCIYKQNHMIRDLEISIIGDSWYQGFKKARPKMISQNMVGGSFWRPLLSSLRSWGFLITGYVDLPERFFEEWEVRKGCRSHN